MTSTALDYVAAGEDLLPPNATPLEQQTAITWRRIQEIDPSPLSTIWDPWSCPAALLPFLAWALSVNIWNDSWDEIRQRQAVSDSIAFHLIKGSRAAVEQALDTLQHPYTITEWWERTPHAATATARVFVPLDADDLKPDGSGIAPLLAETKRLTLLSKPKSRYVYVGVGIEQDGPVIVGIGAYYAMQLTVQPYVAVLPEADGQIFVGAAFRLSTDLTIQPAS